MINLRGWPRNSWRRDIEVILFYSNVVMVDCVRKMTVKKSCKYGEYGSFEHLLFMFLFWIVFVFPSICLAL